MPELKPLSYSPATAAALIGIHTRTLYRLLADGRITGRRMGSRTLVDGASVRSYYESLPKYVSRPTAIARKVRN
jgi:excisionase family DNA binding protein